MKNISRLHYITTSSELAEQACRGGADWIQLRLKDTSFDEYLRVACDTLAVCRKYGATLIINDNVEVALQSGADGVHLGKTDMDPVRARSILGDNKIIGGTTNTRKDLVRLAGMPVDYAGLGPFRFTATKEKLAPIIGLQGFSRIMQNLREQSVRNIPVIAIGGVRVDDVSEIMDRGIYGVAVSGAISAAADVTAMAAQFVYTIQQKQNEKHV